MSAKSKSAPAATQQVEAAAESAKAKRKPRVADEEAEIWLPDGNVISVKTSYERFKTAEVTESKPNQLMYETLLAFVAPTSTGFLKPKDFKTAKRAAAKKLERNQTVSAGRLMKAGLILRIKPPGSGFHFALSKKGGQFIKDYAAAEAVNPEKAPAVEGAAEPDIEVAS